MANSYIKILKEANGDITYPQTLASAVHTNSGSDVETEMSKYVTAEEIASTSALTPPVQTNMIADEAVTSAKIDFTSFIAGAASFTAISAGADQNAKVNIPAQANTNYLVFLTIADHTPYWTELIYRPSEKTTTSFKITAANNGNGSTGAFNINYLVIPQ